MARSANRPLTLFRVGRDVENVEADESEDDSYSDDDYDKNDVDTKERN